MLIVSCFSIPQKIIVTIYSRILASAKQYVKIGR